VSADAVFVARVTASAEVVPGPLTRFLALAEQIRSEGLEVPSEIAAALEAAAAPRST
jgi:hypothetical protein